LLHTRFRDKISLQFSPIPGSASLIISTTPLPFRKYPTCGAESCRASRLLIHQRRKSRAVNDWLEFSIPIAIHQLQIKQHFFSVPLPITTQILLSPQSKMWKSRADLEEQLTRRERQHHAPALLP